MYEGKTKIKYHEVNGEGSVPLHVLCHHFQEAAGVDAHSLEAGWDHLTPQGLAWVIMRIEMHILGYASSKDTLNIKTWHSSADKVLSRRDFIITADDGREILRGASWWIIMDSNTRRITRLPKDFADKAHKEFVIEESDFPKKNFEGETPVNTLDVITRQEDLDINNHVNNLHYIAWAMESVPGELSAGKELVSFQISFKSECKMKEKVQTRVYKEDENTYWHSIVKESDGKEAALVRTVWKDK